MSVDAQERLRRWRLVLGGEQNDGLGFALSGADTGMDGALTALYDSQTGQGNRRQNKDRRGGLGSSMPDVSRWLGDIRHYFPASVVQIIQQDAIERIGLLPLLLQEPDILDMIELDVHLVATILTLKHAIPNQTKATARLVVQKVVAELIRRLQNPTRQAINGALHRAVRNRRPRHREIDWNRTIRANLRHYQAEYKTIIPETLVGYGRKRSALRDVILCLDQSGSMATSVVYGSILGAVMASLPALRTSLVVFDTAVIDLTANLQDPVDLLFGVQLGGGTDIQKALTYCQGLVTRPQETVMVLISDLYEGGRAEAMLRRVGELVNAGVQLITLLALNDEGKPSYDHRNAAAFASLGVPAFACTPDLFPDLMAAAINRQDITQWAAKQGIAVSAEEES